ncbi:MAG: monovalent cation/H+ antiporter complex subunit F [Solirubrobacteraceae bacterium]
MRGVFIAVALAELLVALPLLVRLAKGPSICDRIVALNTISTQAALSLLFYSAYADRTIYLDIALWLASFSYLGTIVWSRYLERGLL